MDFRDVDKVLDMRVVFSFSGSLPITQFSRRFNFSFQSGLHFGENALDLSYFIPEHLGENREVSIFLTQTNAIKESNVYLMNYSLARQELYSALRGAVTRIKSTVLDNLFLNKGTYYLSMRFHSSDLEAVSSTVLGYANLLDGMGVSSLGHNPGLEAIFKDIKQSSTIKFFQWQVNVPESILKTPPFSALPDEWVGESRYMTTGTDVSELIKTEDKLKDPKASSLTVISEEDNLYEVDLNNVGHFMESYFRGAYESRILRFSRGLYFEDGVLHLQAAVPGVLSDKLMRVLSATRESFPDWNLTLTKVFE